MELQNKKSNSKCNLILGKILIPQLKMQYAIS